MLDDNLEDYFKENLENVHTSWDKEAFWDDLEPMLPAEKKRRPVIWFWAGGFAAALLLTGLATWFMTDSSLDKKDYNPSIDIKKQALENEPIATNNTTLKNTNSITKKTGINTKNINPIITNKVDDSLNSIVTKKSKSNKIPDNVRTTIYTTKNLSTSIMNTENTTANNLTIVTKTPVTKPAIVSELPKTVRQLTPTKLYVGDLDLIDFEKKPFENRIIIPSIPTKSQLSIIPYIGVGTINRTLTSSIPNNELLDVRNEQETTLEAIDLGIQIRKTWQNGLFVQSGIEVSTIHERLNYTESEVENITIQSDTASYYQSFTGATLFRKGEIEAQSVTNTRFERHNQLQSLNIPLLMGYQKHIGRFNINLAVGPVFTIHQQFKGYAYNDEMNVVASNQLDITQKPIVRNLDAIANIDFPLYQNMRMVAGIKYRYGLSSPILNSTISQQYKVGSAFIGLKFTI